VALSVVLTRSSSARVVVLQLYDGLVSSGLARATFTRMQDGTAEEYALIHAREAAYNRTYLGHPWFDATVEFCERYDENCFDPDYDWLPLEHFAPAVEEVFCRAPAFR
jgi:predicted HD phosphohydrolase